MNSFASNVEDNIEKASEKAGMIFSSDLIQKSWGIKKLVKLNRYTLNQ